MANEHPTRRGGPPHTTGGTTSLRFAAAARVLADGCRALGLVPPGFRSPPRVDGVHRSVRRYDGHGATVSVLVRGRPWGAVLADMIEGVVVTNRLGGAQADEVRTALWARAEAADLAGPLSATPRPGLADHRRQGSGPARSLRSVAPSSGRAACPPDAA